ncbi:hypothetical protein BGX30_013911, partial [Mortierella sp. GBA39]
MNQDFLDIPELVAHLSPYLSPADLLSCVQLNSAWNKTFIPFLWGSIDDSAQSWGDILLQITDPRPQPPPPATIDAATGVTTANAPGSSPVGVRLFDTHKSCVHDSDLFKDCEWLFAIFEKYGHHVRELKISHTLVLEAASRKETCTSLHTLVLDLNQNAEGPHLECLPPPPRLGAIVSHPGWGTATTLEPITPVGVFEDAPSVAFGRFGAAPADVPDAAAGGFGIAPAVALAATGGLGAARALQVPNPSQEPDVELSEPLFPGHLKLADFRTTALYENVTPESKMANMEHIWTLTQHTWHLIRVNPGLHLKDLDGKQHLFGRIGFWKLWDALPAEIESLSFENFSSPTVFPLPESLPGASTSLKILRAGGITTVNGLLTLLGIFPKLTQLALWKIEENPRYTSSPNYTPLPPAPFGGQSLRELDCIVEDWDTVLRYIPSIAVWEIGSRCFLEDVALLLKDRCLNLETLRAFPPCFIDERYIRYMRYMPGIRGNDPTNQFLITHRHLREFDSIRNFIKVDEMLREPWTCMGLEWLTCRIVGLDRLTPIEEGTVARIMASGYSADLSEEETGVVE